MATPVLRELDGTILLPGTPFPGPPASARRQRAAPGTTFTPIALENSGGLIRGLGLYEEIDFCWTTARTSSFLTKSFPESRLPHFSHTFPLRHEQHAKVVRCSGDEEYSGLRKCQWHKGGRHESADHRHGICVWQRQLEH
jgi:hypothetical protein